MRAERNTRYRIGHNVCIFSEKCFELNRNVSQENLYTTLNLLAHVRNVQLEMQRHIPQEMVNKFFDTRKCTPDLTELFQGIDRSRLKRTSSAIWKTPPRFSMMEDD